MIFIKKFKVNTQRRCVSRSEPAKPGGLLRNSFPYDVWIFAHASYSGKLENMKWL